MSRDVLFTPAVRSAETMRTRFEIDNLLSVALGAAFLGTGVAKIGATRFVVETFEGWPFPAWMLVAIGALEVLAAVLTLIPTTRLLGTGLIASVMVGAISYHVSRAELLLVTIPLTALVVAVATFLLELSLRRAEASAQAAYVR